MSREQLPEQSTDPSNRRIKRAVIGGVTGVLGLLVGASIHQSITVGDETVRFPAKERICTFDDATKAVTRETEERLGSLAVRTIPGVNWGQCSSEAQAWINEHNPDLKDEPGEMVIVPVQVFVE